MSGFYLALGILSLCSVFSALVKARRLYFFVPVYFFSAWLCGELAFIHLLWQLSLTFDIFHSVRSEHVLNAVTEFLEWCHARRVKPVEERAWRN